MSEYPPGSVGERLDSLDATFAQLGRTRNPVLRFYVWRRRRRLAAYRERMRRSIPRQLEATGFVSSEMRAAMERADRRAADALEETL